MRNIIGALVVGLAVSACNQGGDGQGSVAASTPEKNPTHGYPVEAPPANLVERFQYYDERAQAGDREAMVGLADAYRDGRGVEKDAYAYVDYLRKAAAAGHPRALDHLHGLYEHGYSQFYVGTVVEANPEVASTLGPQAFDAMQAAADAGNVDAMFQVAGWYDADRSDKAPVDLQKDPLVYERKHTAARKRLQQLSDDGVGGATCELARSYRDGLHGVREDRDRAIGLFEKCAEYDPERAHGSLAHMFQDDSARFFEEARKAASYGGYAGLMLLGEALAKTDPDKAIPYLVAAHEQDRFAVWPPELLTRIYEVKGDYGSVLEWLIVIAEAEDSKHTVGDALYATEYAILRYMGVRGEIPSGRLSKEHAELIRESEYSAWYMNALQKFSNFCAHGQHATCYINDETLSSLKER